MEQKPHRQKGIACRKTSHNKVEFIEFEVVSGLQGIGKRTKKYIEERIFSSNF